MSSKHTPAPWKAVSRTNVGPNSVDTWEVHYGDDTECIAEYVAEGANAALIAAAPELLEVLREYVQFINSEDYELGELVDASLVARMYAAIAQAAGREAPDE